MVILYLVKVKLQSTLSTGLHDHYSKQTVLPCYEHATTYATARISHGCGWAKIYYNFYANMHTKKNSLNKSP